MADLSKRATVYFDPAIHQALRLKAATNHSLLSELLDEAVRLLMREDQEDLAAIAQRANEPEMSYEALLEVLKEDGKYSISFKASVAKDFEDAYNYKSN